MDARALLTGPAAVVHVAITAVHGSAPREVGAEMFVTATAMAGTIGGGQAEYQALNRARDMLAHAVARDTLQVVLGPEVGQCCGGKITLALTRLSDSAKGAHLARLDAAARPTLLILGAGHVGRALARVALTLPCLVIVADPRAAELAQVPSGAESRLTPLPEAEIAIAPPGSAFVITTHDHGLDFLLTLAALRRGDAAYVGLIGSATKRARFERFARGTSNFTDLARLTCPIGAAGLGDKRPEVIALMTAQEVFCALRHWQASQTTTESRSA
ncbi:MAG: xanthine dehydrogenase accessory protein XdhC [Roseinatronobacter sp.]